MSCKYESIIRFDIKMWELGGATVGKKYGCYVAGIEALVSRQLYPLRLSQHDAYAMSSHKLLLNLNSIHTVCWYSASRKAANGLSIEVRLVVRHPSTVSTGVLLISFTICCHPLRPC